MKKHTVQSLLRNADADSIARMARLSPMSSDSAKERIFRRIQSRSEQPEHWEETVPAPIVQSGSSGGVGRAFAALAACAAIAGTGIFCVNLMQDKKPLIEPRSAVVDERETVQPETENAIVYQEDERHQSIDTLEEANALDFPWQGKVIQAEAIGDMLLNDIYTTTLSATDADGVTTTYDALDVVYRDPDDPEHHGIAISYFLMPAEYMAPDAVSIDKLTDNPELSYLKTEESPNGGVTVAAVLECGDFRIDIKGDGIRDEEAAMALTEVRDAFFPQVPDVTNYHYEYAQKILQQEAYNTEIVYEFDDTVDAGHVIRTDPPAGSACLTGETVTLIVSRGAEDGYRMDSCVVGKMRDQAEGLGAYFGLKTECIYVPSDLPKDTVIAQSIAEGEFFKLGDTITFTLSDGSGTGETVEPTTAEQSISVPTTIQDEDGTTEEPTPPVPAT